MPARADVRSALFAFAVLLIAVAPAAAENWPNWRGPTNNGISQEKNLATEWDSEKNVAWKVALPGQAGATPVVWEDRIFLTSESGEDLVLICIGTDGKKRWQQVVGRGRERFRSDEGNLASPSPVTDGRHVWSFMGEGSLACFDFDGKLIWETNLQDRYGRFRIQFGMASTPVLHENTLYFQLIHGEGDAKTREALVLALDKSTGDEVWKRDRPSDAHTENEHSYASPMLYDYDGLQLLLTHGADYTVAHSLKDGREIWRVADLNPKGGYDPTLRFVSSPATAPGIIVIPTAKKGPVMAVRPDAKGTITARNPGLLWSYARTPDVPSPLIHGGFVYLCMENGNLHCLDAKTGQELYQERTQRERHRASPVYADGKIYLTARNGIITVVKAGRDFEILAENSVGEPISASPAISNGTIYLRSFESLWAIRAK